MFIVILIASLIILPLVSLLFFKCGGALPLQQRLAASAHAMLIAVIVFYGITIDFLHLRSDSWLLELPILLSLVLSVASMLYSLWVFRSRPVLHLAHLITVLVGVPTVFVSLIAVGGWT